MQPTDPLQLSLTVQEQQDVLNQLDGQLQAQLARKEALLRLVGEEMGESWSSEESLAQSRDTVVSHDSEFIRDEIGRVREFMRRNEKGKESGFKFEFDNRPSGGQFVKTKPKPYVNVVKQPLPQANLQFRQLTEHQVWPKLNGPTIHEQKQELRNKLKVKETIRAEREKEERARIREQLERERQERKAKTSQVRPTTSYQSHISQQVPNSSILEIQRRQQMRQLLSQIQRQKNTEDDLIRGLRGR